MQDPEPSVTELLQAWNRGDTRALDALTPRVLRELRALARRHLAGERKNHTLQPTALINEAYLRLVEQRNVRWQNRAHFFAIAARMMRRILTDHARRRRAQKRDVIQVTLDEAIDEAKAWNVDALEINEALDRLAVGLVVVEVVFVARKSAKWRT